MKNLKIRCQVTPEQSRKIQKAFFAKGGRRSSGSAVVAYTYSPFLFIHQGELHYTENELVYMELNPGLKQVFAHEALELIQNCSQEDTYVIDVRDTLIAVRRQGIGGNNVFTGSRELDKDTPGLICLWSIPPILRYDATKGMTTEYHGENRASILSEAQTLCDKLNKGEQWKTCEYNSPSSV